MSRRRLLGDSAAPAHVYRRTVGVAVTLLLVSGAAGGGVVIWNYYLTGPWTRDGQVQAYVVSIAPQVSGRVAHLRVNDNQQVNRGDVLFEIESVDFEVAVAFAEANVQSKQADMEARRQTSERRNQLTTLSTSVEERQTFQSNSDQARAAYAMAVAQLTRARIDLKRTRVTSPVNGYVTNLQLQEGDYGAAGTRTMSVLNTDSFWIAGFFEETKISGIKVGDPAAALLLGFRDPVRGHVESIAQGINTPSTTPGALGLASVDPIFTWVRLAQRIPVRIHIDEIPATVHLAAGMTATVSVGTDAAPGTLHGLLSRVLTQKP